MSFQGPALSFTSLFGDGLKSAEHQNHIFPESGIVTCSIIESSRGSLICVPVTDAFSSDCDSYLTVTELGTQKESSSHSKNWPATERRESSSVDCMQEQHDEETESRLFVHTQLDPAEDGSEVLLLANGDNPSAVSNSFVIQEESRVVQEDTPQHEEEVPPAAEPDKKAPKKKGGWPKGKKRRKGLNVTAAPKAPATGYVLFLNKRRKQIRHSNPELPFSEVTKQIGNEWTNLPMQDKQVYLKRAEEEKKRYRQELKEYQESEAYLTYSAKKKTVQVEVTPGRKDGNETVTVPIHDIEEEDFLQLYCDVCDIFFTSVHNKKEHFYGRQHLSNITGAIHHVGATADKNTGNENELEAGRSEESSGMPRLKDSVVSVSDAMDLLVSLFRDQGSEIEFLKQSNTSLRQNNSALERDLKLLEDLYGKREEELEVVRTEGKTLSSQLVDLRMVPKLFGIINF